MHTLVLVIIKVFLILIYKKKRYLKMGILKIQIVYANYKAKSHVGLISLPSKTHLLTASVEEQLNKLKASSYQKLLPHPMSELANDVFDGSLPSATGHLQNHKICFLSDEGMSTRCSPKKKKLINVV